MLHYIYYETEGNFLEAKEYPVSPNRLDMIYAEKVGSDESLFQVKEKILSPDRVKLIVGPKEVKKKK